MTQTKILSLFLCFCLILEQGVFAQTIDLSRYFANSGKTVIQNDKFRPLHLRYISYDGQTNDFQVLLDKGDFFNQQTPKFPNSSTPKLEEAAQELMKYFFIGLSLPNEKFWVNLRPDSPDNILDPDLEKTDIGRIFLEADLQLKKDTSGMTSPQTPEGKAYWDRLYKKAGELFGSQNITIPAITRPWIVPAETIIGESPEGAYIYKATLKVMLEEDYLIGRGGSRTAPTYQQSVFSDPRLKELNEYSTQLIREAIIPKLTYAVNTSKRYAPLRQVYYSLILAQWFKGRFSKSGSLPERTVPDIINLIDSGNLANLTSKEPYDKQAYFRQYQKSFQDGEYNLREPVYTPTGQGIRRYVSGGVMFDCSSALEIGKINIANTSGPNRPYLFSPSYPLKNSSSGLTIKAEWKKMRDFHFPESNIQSDGIVNITYSLTTFQDVILKLKICNSREHKNFYFYDMRTFTDKRYSNTIYMRNIKTKGDVWIGIKIGFKDEIFIDWFIGEELIFTNYKIGEAMETFENNKRVIHLDIRRTIKAIEWMNNLMLTPETDIHQNKIKKFVKGVIDLYQKGRLFESFIMDKIDATFGQELKVEEKKLLRKIVVLDTTEDSLFTHLREFKLLLYRYDIVLRERNRSLRIIENLNSFIKETKNVINIFCPEEGADIKKVFSRLERVTKEVSSPITKKNLPAEGHKHLLSSSPAAQIMPNKLQAQPSMTEANNDKGGIDFSRPEIITRPVSELQSLADSPLAVNPNLDFEGEWRGIQMVFNAGIRPSARRMAEFAAAAASSPMNSRRLEDLRGLVTDLLRRDEEDEKPAPVDPALKELLAIL